MKKMKKRSKFLFFITICLFVFPLATDAEKNSNLRKQFKIINQTTVWPVKGTDVDQIVSPFGPRWVGRYDWHFGLDIKADQGTAVKAVKKGEVFAVENYSGGGNTVILKHQFPNKTKFKGVELEYYYTFYMHLDTINVEVGDKVKKNKKIGTVGQTGNAGSPHLHLELRVGEPWGYTSEVNPMYLFEKQKKSLNLKQAAKRTIRFYSKKEKPLLNGIKLKIKNKKNKLVKTYILNFNRRTGFDATSTETLDLQDLQKLYISPVNPTLSTTNYRIEIIIPEKYKAKKFIKVLRVYDIWGRSQSLKFQ